MEEQARQLREQQRKKSFQQTIHPTRIFYRLGLFIIDANTRYNKRSDYAECIAKRFMNASLFCIGVVVGRPRSLRAPMAHRASNKTGPSKSVT